MNYLYRALNQTEITVGYQLLPKGIRSFEFALARTNTANSVEINQYFDKNALLGHIQRLPTSGVSTTTNIEVAKRYAVSGPAPTYRIVRINRDKLGSNGIKEYTVKNILEFGLIEKPEDDEVVLSNGSRTAFPTEIIENIYEIKGSDLKEIYRGYVLTSK